LFTTLAQPSLLSLSSFHSCRWEETGVRRIRWFLWVYSGQEDPTRGDSRVWFLGPRIHCGVYQVCSVWVVRLGLGTEDSSRVQTKNFEMVGHFFNSSWMIGHVIVYKVNAPCWILIGHFKEMVRNWPVASCYLHSAVVLCTATMTMNAKWSPYSDYHKCRGSICTRQTRDWYVLITTTMLLVCNKWLSW